MCGTKAIWYKGDRHPGRHSTSGDLFGLETESMSPKAQIAAALSVLVPVALGTIFVLSFVPGVFWLIFVFGWMIFPSLGLLIRGLVGLSATLSGDSAKLSSASSKEQELLEALGEHGELTPTTAAIETSLTVAEAERMLKELAEQGHLEVRAHGRALFYALWENKHKSTETRQLEESR
jgi:hypothetical protein